MHSTVTEPSPMMTHRRMFSLFPSNVIISGQFNLNTGIRVISEDLPPVIILCKKDRTNLLPKYQVFLLVCLIIF